jgi:cytochrome P450
MYNFKKFIFDTIDERKICAGNIEDKSYIDLYLEQKEKAPSGSIFTEDQLAHACMDLFVAGSETTSKSQEFLIALMMHYPDVQAKVHAELDSVATGRRYIDMNDKDKLPYTEATLSEAWRHVAVAPFGPPRIGHKDVRIGKYLVPKGTFIMYNTHTMHMDPLIWRDPQVFRPERFLVNGKFEPSDRLFPFGIGRRRCLGETLARMENFLFFTNLMLNYTFKPINGKPPSLEPEAGFTNGPFPYSCIINRRF